MSVQEELLEQLGSMYRMLVRKNNHNPEAFSILDTARMNKALEVMKKHSPPFDPKQVLRRSDVEFSEGFVKPALQINELSDYPQTVVSPRSAEPLNQDLAVNRAMNGKSSINSQS